jgi:hypothetical protein
MKFLIEKELYNAGNYPQTGKHIMAHTSGDLIVVYQAFRKSVADNAVKHQKFGGPDYSFNRMSWIKPNFLWMMYRSGWSQKEGQERILALWITKDFFNDILEESVVSSFNASLYKNAEEWKRDLDNKEVRLQWDPDHDPYGAPVERRAIQLGLKGTILKDFATNQLHYVEDVTPFVTEQFAHVQKNELHNLTVPIERVYVPQRLPICSKIEIDQL